ncbi:hypothetical protein [Micromonospora zhanjiangensis]|uniref:Uncharacterized protein n=1 Tax=Micromonospora zhanjiangensis TaxID=1522057 RepID=A0ABV8KJM3_9ACTN
MDEVLARLKAAIEDLDTAAVTATRAAADARQAEAHYREAGTGSDHRAAQGAVDESTTAAEKAGKVARLLAETGGHLIAYVNTIAPGAVPTDRGVESAVPTGEQLVTESVRRSDARAGFAGFLSKMTRNVEDIQDVGKSATEVAQTSYSILKDPTGPTGAKSTGTTTPTIRPANPPAKIEAAEAVGHLLAAGLVVAIAVHRSGQMIRREFARLRSHADEKRNQRPHPRDGST